MLDVIYSKASVERRERFRQLTVIARRTDDSLAVIKQPCGPLAAAHVLGYAENGEKLTKAVKAGSGIKIAPWYAREDGAVEFDFYEVGSFTELLSAQPVETYAERVIQLRERMADAFGVRECQKDRYPSDLLGEWRWPDRVETLRITDLDISFDNIFVMDHENEYVLIDYEWVSEADIPFPFVLYRALSSDVTFSCFSKEDQDWILERLGINETVVKASRGMEEHFQYFISGKNKLDQFHTEDQKVVSVRDLMVYRDAYYQKQQECYDLLAANNQLNEWLQEENLRKQGPKGLYQYYRKKLSRRKHG